MTSTPVKDVGFGLGGAASVGTGVKTATDGGFQAVWNNQSGKQADSTGQPEDNRAVKKTPGDSLKARDEHRARTEKREPSRNVEERTDIPEEKLEEAAEVLEAAAVQMIQEVADTFGMEPGEIREAMAELGLEQTDILDPKSLSGLILAVSGAGSEGVPALLTNEELYGSYQELMGRLETVLQECGATLEVSPEQLTLLTGPEAQPLQPEQGPVEMTPDEVKPDGMTQDGMTPDRAIPDEALSGEAVEEPQNLQEPRERSGAVEGKQGPVSDAGQPPEQTPAREADGRNAGGNRGRDSRGESRHEGGREPGVNLLAQSLRGERFEPQVQQAYGGENVWDADTQNIMRQIMDYMKVNLKAEMSTMEMQLHPESLGTLQVQVASKGGVVTASFITQNEAVKSALESQMIQLQEQFQEQGVKVEAIEVTVQTHQFEQNLEQGRRGSGQEQEPQRKGRTRRINLNDSFSAEEMEEEDILAKDMMLASGNTVDFTA